MGTKDLLHAIKTIATGQSLLGPKETAHILSWMKDTTSNTPAILPPAISPVDLKLLSMLAEGATNKAVAAAFEQYPNVITKLLSTLYKKLHVRRRTQAIHYFITQLSQHYDLRDVKPISTHGKGWSYAFQESPRSRSTWSGISVGSRGESRGSWLYTISTPAP